MSKMCEFQAMNLIKFVCLYKNLNFVKDALTPTIFITSLEPIKN